MAFEVFGEIKDIETIATGRGVYLRRCLNRTYGAGRWRKRMGIATVRLADGTVCDAEIHWFEAHGIGRRDMKIKRAFLSEFIICLKNKGSAASLTVGKVYRTLPDPKAAAHKLVRVLDEDRSERDGYLYPATMFAAIELPETTRRALTAAGL